MAWSSQRQIIALHAPFLRRASAMARRPFASGWNPGAIEVVKLNDGDIGVGSRFRARWRNAPTTIVEVVEFSPPPSWTTHARSLGMDVRFGCRLTALDGRTRYVAEVEVRPRGIGYLWAWLAVRAMRRQEPENLCRIKAALEG
jgi:hypothetical protein